MLRVLFFPFTMLAFKLNPVKFAMHAMYGNLMRRGFSKRDFPIGAITDLAEDSLRYAEFVSLNKGTFRLMLNLQEALEHTALQVEAVLLSTDRTDLFLSVCGHTKMILEKHGMKVGPIPESPGVGRAPSQARSAK